MARNETRRMSTTAPPNVMAAISSTQTTHEEIKRMAVDAIDSVTKHTTMKLPLSQGCDEGSVSTGRTNLNEQHISDSSTTEGSDDEHNANISPRLNVSIGLLMENDTNSKKCTDDNRGDTGISFQYESSSKLMASPIRNWLIDSTAELTASETSTDTKNIIIFDNDIGHDDPPLPNDIPRYIFTRSIKNLSEVASSAEQLSEQQSPSKYGKLQRLLRRWHRPKHTPEIICYDSDSEVICSTLISL